MTTTTTNANIMDNTEVESLLDFCNAPIESSVVPRWQRKALASTKTPKKQDRFIPNRSSMDMDVSSFLLKENPGAKQQEQSPNSKQFNRELAANLFGKEAASALAAEKGKGQRVLAFKNKAPEASEGYHQSIKVLYSQSQAKTRTATARRHIPSAPERVLDAPDLLDDYYLNLLDWSDQNVLAVALNGAVYLWNAGTGEIDELCTLENEDSYISSLSWVKTAGSTHVLAVATSESDVKLYDTEKMAAIRTMRSHSARVGALSWNGHMLSSGGRDSAICNHDVRIANHHVSTYVGHKQEVCGLEWSPDGATLASGGNDNLLCLWDARRSAAQHTGSSTHAIEARHTIGDHCAAVKALAWCPFQRNVLASGGGTADKTIKFWNSGNGACLNSIDTGSQVCALLWSPHEKELLSSHGFSDNQLCLWRYPSMKKVTELKGHTARVLHLSMAPGGDGTVCSAGADETLRFWNVFGGRDRKQQNVALTKKASSSRFGGMRLR